MEITKVMEKAWKDVSETVLVR